MSEWIQVVLETLESWGYIGVAVGLMMEVIPSEIVLSYAGYLVSEGNISFWGAVLAGTIGGTLAQMFLYWAGYYGGRPLIERYGKYIFIKPKHIEMSEKWFRTYGTGVIFFARFIPVVRHAISIPAGLSRMSPWLFTLYTTLAVIPWSIGFIWLGMKLGNNWGAIKEAAHPYMPYLIGSGVLCIICYAWGKQVAKRKAKG